MKTVFIVPLLCAIAIMSLLISPFASGEAGEWVKKKDMPSSGAWFPTCEFNGKIYLFEQNGGAQEYNPRTDTWTQKSRFTPQGDHAAVLVNGKIYVTGSWLGMYEYAPTTDECVKKANTLFETRGSPISAVNGKIYVIGGVQNNAGHSAVQEYDLATDTWTRKKDLPFPWAWQSVCTVDDKIYVFGGWQPGVGAVSTVMEYAPNADEWTKKTDMPTSRLFLPKSAPVINGKIYIIGGYQGTALSVMEIYAPKTDTWTKGPDIPTARFALSTTAVKGKIYAFGGCIGAGVRNQTRTSTVEEYDTGETFPVDAKGKLFTWWGMLKTRF